MRVLVPAPDPERQHPFDDEVRDLAAPLVWTVDGLLPADECAVMIERFEKAGFMGAPINTVGSFERRPDVRNNERVMFDDPELARALFERVRAEVPAQLFCDPLRLAGVNERFRGYRYDPGQQFRDHYDGRFVRNANETSLVTFMIYLNDGFEGGSTSFADFELDVVPKTGTALFFQHALRHAGTAVTRGRKYVLRTDVMYARTSHGK